MEKIFYLSYICCIITYIIFHIRTFKQSIYESKMLKWDELISREFYQYHKGRTNYTNQTIDHFGRKAMDCVNLGYSVQPLPFTALASWPGSGNTWLRHLIQQATGIYTSSIYCDWNIRRFGFPAECRPPLNNSVIVVKTHRPHTTPNYFKQNFTRAILLVRNIYDALKSKYNFLKAGHKYVTRTKLEGSEWIKFVYVNSESWRDLNLNWLLNFTGPLLIVRYESLKSNIAGEIRRICAFLGSKIPDTRMQCLMKNKDGNFKRSGPSLSDPFTEDMKPRLDNIIKKIDIAVKDRRKRTNNDT